jgi:hypothetical protein
LAWFRAAKTTKPTTTNFLINIGFLPSMSLCALEYNEKFRERNEWMHCVKVSVDRFFNKAIRLTLLRH